MEREQLAARAALAAVHDQRQAVADRLVTPWWYHPVLGVLLGGLVVAQATHSDVVRAFSAFAVAAGAGALAALYRRLTGLWVSGWRRDRAGLVTAALVAVVLGGFAVALLLDWRAALVAGVVVAGTTVVLGRRFDAVLRAELRE